MRWLLGCAGIVLALAPTSAHHALAAKFDSSKKVTLRGSVTAIDWANPHAHVFVNVTEPAGRIANWAVELEEYGRSPAAGLVAERTECGRCRHR